MLCESSRTGSGVSGLAVVAADGGDWGLVLVANGEGVDRLGVIGDGRDRPIISANSEPLGFHDVRCMLFFLRTDALYAVRIMVVA